MAGDKLTGAEGQPGDLVETESGDRSCDAKVCGTVAHLFDVAERGSDLLVVGVEFPQGHDLAVDARILRSVHLPNLYLIL